MRVLSCIFLLAVASVAVNASPRLLKRQAPEEPPVAPDTAAAAADAAEPQSPPAPPGAPAKPAAPAPAPARPTPATRPAPPAPAAGAPPAPEVPAGGEEAPEGRQVRPRPPGPRPPQPQPQPQPQGPSSGLTLADGAEVIVGAIQDTFTCQDKIYGYYADVDNGCKIFHVCVPIQDENGQQTAPSLRFSFFCNNGTVFNQAALVCDHEDNVDCASAPSFYNINEEFGKIEPRSGPVPDARAPPANRPAPPPPNRPPPPPPPAPGAPQEVPPTPAA